MELETLKARVYYLAGQLDEAKKHFEDALGELNAANKKVESDKPVEPAASN